MKSEPMIKVTRYFKMSQLACAVALTVPALGLGACGDNTGNSNADAKTSDQIDAAANDSAPARMTGLAIAGDFAAAGFLARIDVTTATVEKNAVPGAADKDPVSRMIGEELFILNRDLNNLTVLDRKTLAVKLQVSTGAGSNPQDAAVAGNKIYVPALGGKGVVVVTRGSMTTTEIDLSNLDGDGRPDCNSAVVVGTQLFVQCGLLKDFASAAGKVVVIDTATDKPTHTLTLPFVNPFGQMIQSPATSKFAGELLVTTVPDFDTGGCVVRIKPGTTPTVGQCAIENLALSAFPAQLAVSADEKVLFAAIKGFSPGAQLRQIDLTTGAISASLSSIAQTISAIAPCPDGSLLVADGDAISFGIRIYGKSGEVTSQPLDIGVKPISGAGLHCF
jgi:DNA-binding beta-propeller fold protein YncE